MGEEYCTYGVRRSTDRVLVDRPEEKIRQGRHGHWWEDNIKKYIVGKRIKMLCIGLVWLRTGARDGVLGSR
jgi:hypothetical protein